MREATSETYGPRVYFSNILLSDLSFCLIFSDLLFQKPKNTLLHFLFSLFILCFWEIYLSNLSLPNISFAAFCFLIYYSKNPKIPWCTFYLPLLFCVLVRSIYPIYYNLIYLFTVERFTTSLTRRVASICSLCAGIIYIVLRGSPTGSMTLVS